MLKRRAFWILLLAGLLAVGAGAAAMKKRQAAAPVADTQTTQATQATPAKAPASLEFLPSDVAEVQPRELRQVLLLSGALRAVNQAQVKAKLAGEVREVLVREGEAVKAGQVLVKIDSTEYQARLEQAKGSLQAARGELAIAAKARDNNQALVAKGFISQNAFDNAASQHDIARANVESAQGALDVAQKALNDSVVRAPIAGLVASRSVQPGEKVSADNHLLELVDLHQLELETAVPTTDILQLTPGQPAQVKLEGLATPLTGRIARISPATQAGSRSVMSYIQLDNPQGLLKVGMFGQAEVTLGSKTGVLSVPPAAIQDLGGSAIVYAIVNGTLRQQAVKLGSRGNDGTGEAVEILDGLAAGALIVRTNLGKLPDGVKVRLAQAPPATPATPAAPAHPHAVTTAASAAPSASR
ncbi:efflux RND transporter periplasmic adaptor subunit [Noviherbaspirillum sedimenti]|uniref:Efflux RND transporter periplasmic adaptor subunit n=1 Tax=Noviherbaspirillum sedimenti TaxID=2320865 RepID=A0A3A3G5P5_9BURK|nr:efflux RND transporter periplasmic adaptor subunit [Noviherbaspirillum sedimenti]RJG03778.1 efflux RND transporter periplasmic adaptor subunit [Noviherbaspirillum sedimenti]